MKGQIQWVSKTAREKKKRKRKAGERKGGRNEDKINRLDLPNFITPLPL